MFIVHGAGDELRDDNQRGYGLYYYRSKKLEEITEKIDTPFGKIRFLTGKKAINYYEQYKFVEDFSKKRRIEFAKRLFGDFKIISNETHQGLANINTMLLGCHSIKDNKILPLALRGDLPAYLVYGKPSFKIFSVFFLSFIKNKVKKGHRIFSMVQLSILRGLPLGRLSTAIPKVSIIWLKNSSDPIGFPLKITELLS